MLRYKSGVGLGLVVVVMVAAIFNETAAQDREANDRYATGVSEYAKTLVKRHDKNGSMTLDGEETKQLRGRAAGADANNDNVITVDEIVARLEAAPDRSSSVGTLTFDPVPQEASAGSEPRKSMTVTVWSLTLVDADSPEGDELEGALRDRAKKLSAVIGSVGEFRDLVDRLRVANMVKQFREIRMMAVDGQTASFQSGAEEPSVVGVEMSQRGRMNQIRMQEVGTKIKAKPLIDGEGRIQIGLDYDSSRMETSDTVALAEVEGGKPLQAQGVKTESVYTTVRMKPGSAVVVSGDLTEGDSTDGAKRETQLLVLGVELVD